MTFTQETRVCVPCETRPNQVVFVRKLTKVIFGLHINNGGYLVHLMRYKGRLTKWCYLTIWNENLLQIITFKVGMCNLLANSCFFTSSRYGAILTFIQTHVYGHLIVVNQIFVLFYLFHLREIFGYLADKCSTLYTDYSINWGLVLGRLHRLFFCFFYSCAKNFALALAFAKMSCGNESKQSYG